MAADNGKAPTPIRARNGLGLGYCLRCLMAHATGQLQGLPEYAITLGLVMVPVTDPLGNTAGMVPASVPLCYGHMQDGKKQTGLFVAGGSLS